MFLGPRGSTVKKNCTKIQPDNQVRVFCAELLGVARGGGNVPLMACHLCTHLRGGAPQKSHFLGEIFFSCGICGLSLLACGIFSTFYMTIVANIPNVSAHIWKAILQLTLFEFSDSCESAHCGAHCVMPMV